LKSVLALAVVIGCLPAPAVAQELRKDSVWDGRAPFRVLDLQIGVDFTGALIVA
jgi:hypothetical protein